MRKLITRLCRGLLLVGCCAATAVAAPPGNEVLRIGVNLDSLRDTSRSDAEISLKVWGEEMQKVLEIPAEINFYKSIPEMRRAFADDRINFVIAEGLDLLRHFNIDELTEGFGGTRDMEGMVLVVRRDSGIKDVRDLPGKRLLLQSGSEISAMLMDTLCLRQFRKACAPAGVILNGESRSHQMVLQLFFGKAEAALVRSHSYQTAIELNPQIKERVEVRERYPVYPSALGMFSSRVSPAFRAYAIAKASHLKDYPRGRQILEVMQTQELGHYPRTILDPIRNLVREHEFLVTRHGSRKATQ